MATAQPLTDDALDAANLYLAECAEQALGREPRLSELREREQETKTPREPAIGPQGI